VRDVLIALVGAPDSGHRVLADYLRRDPSRPDVQSQAPVLLLDLQQAEQPFSADLILMVVDRRKQDLDVELGLTTRWINQGQKVLVFFNQLEPPDTNESELTWPGRYVVTGPVEDARFLHSQFSSVVMELLPGQLLGLGRQFPLFRVPIAHHLINETCMSNATYALGTGLAEVVGVLNLPLTLADMVILTKTQAFLVYKLGLVFGFSLEWRDYLAEFGGIIGGGFLWRQLARTLVGLIPVVGILPKVAVAYSGTYVIGHAILQWYLTGRHLTKKQLKSLTAQAFGRGRDTARRLLPKSRRPRLEAGTRKPPKKPKSRLRKTSRLCAECGKVNAPDANFCQFCGAHIDSPVEHP
jgi:uncharacterized protein (DUF697 family)